MEFRAYRRPDGAYVLVPDCLVASRDAEVRHGPLVLIATLAVDCPSDDPVWHRVLGDIDRQSYAVVRRETGEHLVRIGSRASVAV